MIVFTEAPIEEPKKEKKWLRTGDVNLNTTNFKVIKKV